MQPDYYGGEPRSTVSDPHGGYGAKPIQESRIPLLLTVIVLATVCFFAFRFILGNRPAQAVKSAPPAQAAPITEPVATPAASYPTGSSPSPSAPEVFTPRPNQAITTETPREAQRSEVSYRPEDKSPGWKLRAVVETTKTQD